jgi:hypothetical protein
MHIKNINKIPQSEMFRCGKVICDYLVSKGFSVLGINDRIYYFAATDKLEIELEKMPFWMKIFLAFPKGLR